MLCAHKVNHQIEIDFRSQTRAEVFVCSRVCVFSLVYLFVCLFVCLLAQLNCDKSLVKWRFCVRNAIEWRNNFTKPIWPSSVVLISLHWCHCPQNENKTTQNRAEKQQQQYHSTLIITINIYFPLQSRKLYCGKVDKAASRQQFIYLLRLFALTQSPFLLQCITQNKQTSIER